MLIIIKLSKKMMLIFVNFNKKKRMIIFVNFNSTIIFSSLGGRYATSSWETNCSRGPSERQNRRTIKLKSAGAAHEFATTTDGGEVNVYRCRSFIHLTPGPRNF